MMIITNISTVEPHALRHCAQQIPASPLHPQHPRPHIRMTYSTTRSLNFWSTPLLTHISSLRCHSQDVVKHVRLQWILDAAQSCYSLACILQPLHHWTAYDTRSLIIYMPTNDTIIFRLQSSRDITVSKCSCTLSGLDCDIAWATADFLGRHHCKTLYRELNSTSTPQRVYSLGLRSMVCDAFSHPFCSILLLSLPRSHLLHSEL